MRKSYFISLIFLVSISAWSQIDLKVHLKRSQSEKSSRFMMDTLKIYKDNLLFKATPGPDSFVLYESVPNGDYEFCYKNIFGERIEKTITLTENNNILGQQEVSLDIDQLQKPRSKNLFITNLKDDETLTINLRISGCFTSGTDSIKIYKKANQLFLLYKSKSRKLETSDIEAIELYEDELRSLRQGSLVSTLNGYNEIILNEEKYSYRDYSLFWGGFEILIKNLKLK